MRWKATTRRTHKRLLRKRAIQGKAKAKMQGALHVATKLVDDPFGGRSDRLLVTVHKGEDAIEWLYSHKLISEVRYAVELHFRKMRNILATPI